MIVRAVAAVALALAVAVECYCFFINIIVSGVFLPTRLKPCGVNTFSKTAHSSGKSGVPHKLVRCRHHVFFAYVFDPCQGKLSFTEKTGGSKIVQKVLGKRHLFVWPDQ